MAIGLGLPTAALLHACAASALVRAVFSSATTAGFSAPDLSAARASRPSDDAVLAPKPFETASRPTGIQPEPTSTVQPKARIDPLRAPRCAGVTVVATSQSEDPLESIAVVQASGEPRGFVRRVGNSVSGRRLVFIGRNPREWSPAVWFIGADGLCQAVLRDQAPAGAPPPRSNAAASPTPKKVSPVLSPAITKKVANLGAGNFLIERSAAETIMEQATELLRSLRVRPMKVGEKVVGFELRRVAPGTLLDVLGLKDGDVLQSVNGFELTGPAQALQAYARLRTADNVRVKALRNGRAVELEYRIR